MQRKLRAAQKTNQLNSLQHRLWLPSRTCWSRPSANLSPICPSRIRIKKDNPSISAGYVTTSRFSDSPFSFAIATKRRRFRTPAGADDRSSRQLLGRPDISQLIEKPLKRRRWRFDRAHQLFLQRGEHARNLLGEMVAIWMSRSDDSKLGLTTRSDNGS
jgi:hypothetical protein